MGQAVSPAGLRSPLLSVNGKGRGVLQGHGTKHMRDAVGDSGAWTVLVLFLRGAVCLPETAAFDPGRAKLPDYGDLSRAADGGGQSRFWASRPWEAVYFLSSVVQ